MRTPRWTPAALVLIATVAQLLVATFARDLPQFAGKAFGARLVFYPLLMLFVPVVWFVVHRRRRDAPWAGLTLVMTPFLVDVTGNTLDLYDTVVWWDDLLHFTNWCLLTLGLGLVLGVARVRPRWARAVATIGGGALLALLWEIGEWWTFIRHGTELATAYEDTLGDMVLGTAGSTVALAVLVLLARRAPTAREAHLAP
ncbi:hypothetical protein [Kineococcus rhizosphaerae]|uniref:Uncharacterized protein n=1 Tax=Kineococcus rhizosphaerae TaxID=559628 RepID=A0A2T0R5V3_9ACTN|nr:hypothetical protein [Kineococcus rhizosphaerae]PRY16114.1 hypothetical protein CLV37_104334 [Kineococcus rhizosphaerae]